MAIIASIQTQYALNLLLSFGKILDYLMCNALSGEFSISKQNRDLRCPVCGTKPPKKLTKETSDKELLDKIKELEGISGN